MRGDPVRDEAERLVSAAVTALSLAARGIPRTGQRAIATGSDECCICPLCRLIASMRDPSAEMTDRLATGAGDLATAVAGVLRLLSRGGEGHAEEPASREGDEFWESLRQRAAEAARRAAVPVRSAGTEDPWRQATTTPEPPPVRPMAKKAVAKKAVKRAAPAAGAEDVPGPAAAMATAPLAGNPPPVAKKAVAKKTAAKKAVAKKADGEQAVAKKAAKKAAAKKATKKATPPRAERGSD